MQLKAIVCTLSVLAIAGFSTPSFARLADAFKNLPTEIVRDAVHIPTGCMAKVTMNDAYVVTAKITDPLCLPKGVSARAVPGEKTDFTIVKTR